MNHLGILGYTILNLSYKINNITDNSNPLNYYFDNMNSEDAKLLLRNIPLAVKINKSIPLMQLLFDSIVDDEPADQLIVIAKQFLELNKNSTKGLMYRIIKSELRTYSKWDSVQGDLDNLVLATVRGVVAIRSSIVYGSALTPKDNKAGARIILNAISEDSSKVDKSIALTISRIFGFRVSQPQLTSYGEYISAMSYESKAKLNYSKQILNYLFECIEGLGYKINYTANKVDTLLRKFSTIKHNTVISSLDILVKEEQLWKEDLRA